MAQMRRMSPSYPASHLLQYLNKKICKFFMKKRATFFLLYRSLIQSWLDAFVFICNTFDVNLHFKDCSVKNLQRVKNLSINDTDLPNEVSVEVMCHINGEDPLSDRSRVDDLSSDAFVNKHNLKLVKFYKNDRYLRSFVDDPSTYHTRSGEALLLHLRFLQVASASYDI